MKKRKPKPLKSSKSGPVFAEIQGAPLLGNEIAVIGYLAMDEPCRITKEDAKLLSAWLDQFVAWAEYKGTK